ncbi:MAG: acyl-CoA thioesterase [Pirellulaceae bacterium]|nr:acyl-CoA thioesterase [Pirellulaceae bacterium]
MTAPFPSQPFRTTRRVEFSDTDAAGIAHFTAFFRWMEQAEHELLRSLGLSVFMQMDGQEITWPRVSSKCDFRSMAKFEEVLEIAASISRLGEKSVTWSFHFTLGPRDIASGEITAVCCRVNPDGTLTSTPIPPFFLAKLQPLTTNH